MGWHVSKEDVISRLANFQKNATRTQQLSPAAAITIYNNAYLTNRGDLLMVVENKTDSESSFLGFTGASPSMSRYGDARSGGHTNYWMCSDVSNTGRSAQSVWTCDTSELDPKTWTVARWKPEYLLSEETDEHCELLLSEPIMIIVIICNALKLIAMLTTLSFGLRAPFVTFG